MIAIRLDATVVARAGCFKCLHDIGQVTVSGETIVQV